MDLLLTYKHENLTTLFYYYVVALSRAYKTQYFSLEVVLFISGRTQDYNNYK